MTEKVQRKLEEMTTDDVIAEVDQPTDWVSSMLVVTKPPSEADGKTKIRICLHPRDMNVAIKREHFPMPTIEEIPTRLNGTNHSVCLMPAMVSGKWSLTKNLVC